MSSEERKNEILIASFNIVELGVDNFSSGSIMFDAGSSTISKIDFTSEKVKIAEADQSSKIVFRMTVPSFYHIKTRKEGRVAKDNIDRFIKKLEDIVGEYPEVSFIFRFQSGVFNGYVKSKSVKEIKVFLDLSIKFFDRVRAVLEKSGSELYYETSFRQRGDDVFSIIMDSSSSSVDDEDDAGDLEETGEEDQKKKIFLSIVKKVTGTEADNDVNCNITAVGIEQLSAVGASEIKKTFSFVSDKQAKPKQVFSVFLKQIKGNGIDNKTGDEINQLIEYLDDYESNKHAKRKSHTLLYSSIVIGAIGAALLYYVLPKGIVSLVSKKLLISSTSLSIKVSSLAVLLSPQFAIVALLACVVALTVYKIYNNRESGLTDRENSSIDNKLKNVSADKTDLTQSNLEEIDEQDSIGIELETNEEDGIFASTNKKDNERESP